MSLQTMHILQGVGFGVAYLMVGFLVGAIARYMLARHLWVKHRLDERPKYGNYDIACWCKEIDVGGDFLFMVPNLAFLLWPLVVVGMILAFPFRVFNRVLGSIDRLARRDRPDRAVSGAKTRVERSDNTLEIALNDVTKKYQDSSMVAEERQKEIYKLQVENDRLRDQLRQDYNLTVEEEFERRTGRKPGEES